MFCTNQMVNLTRDTELRVTSPLHPRDYPNNLNCIWYIRVLDPSGYVTISFYAVNLQPFDDWLDIGVGRNITSTSTVFRLTGTGGPRTATFQEEDLWIRYRSGPVPQADLWNGFEVRLQWQPNFGRNLDTNVQTKF